MSDEKKPWEDMIPKVGPEPDDFDREFIGKINETREKFSQTDFEDFKGIFEDVLGEAPAEDKKPETDDKKDEKKEQQSKG